MGIRKEIVLAQVVSLEQVPVRKADPDVPLTPQCMPGRVKQMKSTCGALSRLCTSRMGLSTWFWTTAVTSPTSSTPSTHSSCRVSRVDV